MYYAYCKKDNKWGILDTDDYTIEYYSNKELMYIVRDLNIEIKGVSITKDLKKLRIRRNVPTDVLSRWEIRHIANKKKSLSFKSNVSVAEYSQQGAVEIEPGFALIETSDSLCLMSKNQIVLDDSERYYDEWEDKWTDITRGLFQSTKFTSIDFTNVDTSGVTDMSHLFDDCEAQYLNLSSFNTSRVKNMDCMFQGCNAKTLDLSNFDTSRVEKMWNMFAACKAEVLDLTSFNTSKVKYMTGMFKCCYAKSLNLSSFDTSGVESFSEMFLGVGNLKKLDISNFDFSMAIDYKLSDFIMCTSIKEIILPDSYAELIMSNCGISLDIEYRTKSGKLIDAKPYYYYR